MKPLLAYALLATGLFLFLAFSGKPPATSSHRRLISRRPQEPRPSFFDLEWEESFGRNAHFSGNSQRNSGHSGFSGENSGEVGGNSGEFGANSGEIYDVTRRLVFLFPLIDVKPKDGFVSYEELEGWNVRQAIEKLQRETEREMRDRDKDGDGTVTLREFLSHVSDAELEINNMANGHPGWWREQFRNADEDGNGSLNLTEFNNFWHPEDCQEPKILQWLCKGKIREMDRNNDSKVDLSEFQDKAYNIYNNIDEFEHLDDALKDKSTPKQIFAKLDINKDGFLTEEDLMPIIHKLHPGEVSYAKDFSKYLMHEADDDKDGKLSIEEMVAHPHAFYSTVFDDDDDDNDNDDYDSHDEL